jgi:hypothetical protein
MSAREPITAPLIQRLLLGVPGGDWNARETSFAKGGQIVAPSGIVGGARSEPVLKLWERTAEIAEFVVRTSDERDFLLREHECDQHKMAEQARRIAELEHQIDLVTRTDDEDDDETFAAEHRRAVGDVRKGRGCTS